MSEIHKMLATVHRSISRGQVWCVKCGNTRKVDPGVALRDGWPKCCGQTMTIDSPEERSRMKAGA